MTKGRRASSATRSASSSRPAAPTVVNGPDLRRSPPGSGPSTSTSGSPSRAGWSPTRRCRRTSPPHGPPLQMPVPKTFEDKPLEHGQGDPRHAAQLRQRRRAAARRRQAGAASRPTPARPRRSVEGRSRRRARNDRPCARSRRSGRPVERSTRQVEASRSDAARPVRSADFPLKHQERRRCHR